MLVCEADLAVDRRDRLAQAVLKAVDIDVSGPYEADLLGSWKQGAECLSRPSVQRRIWPAPNRSLGEQAGQREPSILEMLNHPRASIRMRYHGTERFIDQVGGLPP
jgi:hypothetical protein